MGHTFVTQLQQTIHMFPSIKPRHRCCDAMYCDAFACRCGIKYRW